MSDEREVRVTGTDIAALDEKLKSFGASLPESEQAVLGWLMERAAAAPVDNEVSGYFSQYAAGASALGRQPLYQSLGAQQLARLNPGQLAGVSVVVGVGVMF